MVSKSIALISLVTAISLVSLSVPFLPWFNNKTPKNYKKLYTALLQGYDVAYSGKLKECFNALSQLRGGSIISAFRYFNDQAYGAERIEYSFLNIQKNQTSPNYVWNYWRESVYPNESINIYTSDFSYAYDDEKNAQTTECSFDQFDFRVLQYVKPTNLKTYEKVKKALIDGKIVRLRSYLKTCDYQNSNGSSVAPDIIEGAIIQSYKLFGENSGIEQYIQYTQTSNFQNVSSSNPREMLTNINEVRFFKNGSAIINTNVFDSATRKNTISSWARCQINSGSAHSGIAFFTSDHGIKPF